MKHITITKFILCMIYFNAYAQSNFRDGYIIDNENDTIYGLIDFRDSRNNSRECLFKENENGERIIYSPEDIKAYRFIDGKYYVAKDISIDDTNIKLFLEYLLNGIIDFYFYTDASMTGHYLIDIGNGELRTLRNELNEYYIDNQKYIRESNEYKGMLKYAFRESPTISKKVERLQLNHNSLINIAKEFHYEVCPDEDCIIYEKSNLKYKTTIGILVGMGISTLKTINSMVPNEHYYFNESTFSYPFSPSIGFFVKMNIPSGNERFNLQYESVFNSRAYKSNNIFNDPNYSTINYFNDISIRINSISNNLLLKYEFPEGKIKPAFMAGGFFEFIVRNNYLRDLEIKSNSGYIVAKNTYKDYPLKNSNYGLILGVGGIYKVSEKMELFADLQYKRGFGYSVYMQTSELNINIGIPIIY